MVLTKHRMNVELHLNVLMGTVSRYSVVTLVFFTTYIVFQPPSTIIIRYLGPRVHLSVVVTLWGAVMIGMGFSKDWETLAALRVVLGILEAGFFPSCVYLMSTWYTRYDIGKRYSVFYIFGSLASACAGILAYGLMQLGGREGLTGWRWYVSRSPALTSLCTDRPRIFIIEGALTCFLGIVAYWLLVDFPDKAHTSWKFLTEREAKFIINRVDRDRGDAKPEPWNTAKFFRGGMDLKVWGYALVSCPKCRYKAVLTVLRSSSTRQRCPTPWRTSFPLSCSATWALALVLRNVSLHHRTDSLPSSCTAVAGSATRRRFVAQSSSST